jgi:hypothetical protein
MSSLALNSTVRIVSRSGSEQRTTIRDVIKIGSGKAYEGIMMLDDWPSLLEAYEAEQAAPLTAIKEMLRLAKKTCQKAAWWLKTGLYEAAQMEGRNATIAEVIEAEADFKSAEHKLIVAQEEEFVFYHQAYQADTSYPPPTNEPLAEEPVTQEPVSSIYLNTRSRSSRV